MYGSGQLVNYLELAFEHPLRVAGGENRGSFQVVLTLSGEGDGKPTTRPSHMPR
jgi:hypothetical protein